MRHRQRSILTALVCGALVAIELAGCTTSSSLDALPEAYRTQLGTEAGLAEMTPYILTLRAAYKAADQARLMTNEEFVAAVKADLSFREAWEALRMAVRNKQNPDVAMGTTLAALGAFEQIVLRFDPGAAAAKPSWARR